MHASLTNLALRARIIKVSDSLWMLDPFLVVSVICQTLLTEKPTLPREGDSFLLVTGVKEFPLRWHHRLLTSGWWEVRNGKAYKPPKRTPVGESKYNVLRKRVY